MHYIGMNGSHGYMPDNCFVARTPEIAVEILTDLLELSTRQARELRQTGSVECRPSQGAEYAEVTECNCAEPWIHDENMTEQEWSDQ